MCFKCIYITNIKETRVIGRYRDVLLFRPTEVAPTSTKSNVNHFYYTEKRKYFSHLPKQIFSAEE